MLQVKKRDGESASSLLYRFNKKVKQSGLIKEARKRRFSDRDTSKRTRRLSALHREAKQKEYLRKKKLGLA